MEKRLFAISFLAAAVIFSCMFIFAERERAAARVIETAADEKACAAATAVMEDAVSAGKQEAAARAAQKKKEKKETYLKGLSAYIRHINRDVAPGEADRMASNFVKYGEKYGVDEKVVMAVAQTESAYCKDAVSSADYKGLMQTGDGLAERAGYTPRQLFEPEISIKVGAGYLRDKIEEFGDIRLALTAYNQGSGSVHSGKYTTGYADLTMERAQAVDSFLTNNGYQ